MSINALNSILINNKSIKQWIGIVDSCLEKIRCEVKKFREKRQDNNIEEYDSKRLEMRGFSVKNFWLDFTFQVQYELGIQDIDMKKIIDLNEIRDYLLNYSNQGIWTY